MGKDPMLWGSSGSAAVGLDSTPGLLFVSVEIASTPGFRQCARRLYDTGNLDRIVLDECHLILTSAHYRKSMARLRALRELPVPFVYMTATLPPRLEVELCRRHCMGRATAVRGCSKRPNIHYSVEHLHPPPGEGFLAYACQLIQTHWNDADMSESKGARVMVFLRSCDDAESAAEHLDCEFYHRDIGTVEEKKSRLARWISGESRSPFLACTTAAGAGVDYPHVRWVIHIDDPYGLGEYAQESGRAGRDGELAGASVYMKRNPKQAAPPTPLDHPDPTDDKALKDYLSGAECRRLCFARDLDKAKHWTSCKAGDVMCDVCAETEKLPESEVNGAPRLVQQSEPMREHIDTIADETQEQNDMDTEEGVIKLRRQQLQEQHELDEYLVRLSLVQETCVLCRMLSPGISWHHKMDDCPREHKWEYLRCKKTVLALKQGAKGWIPGFAACYYCGQPQSVCTQWEGGVARMGPTGCRHRDLAIPAMWGLPIIPRTV
jgi:superfamily II DNA helicase RecQ